MSRTSVVNYSVTKKKAIEDQNRVIREGVDYLQTNSEVVISGAAGTGKTTITKKILEKIANRDDKILICALSHQALSVARSFMDKSHLKFTAATNASAIHASRKILPDGKEVFLPKERFTIKNGKRIRIKPPVETAKYIIFDECSQVCEKTLYVLDKLRRPDSKVIFLGDICQLPPITRNEGEKYSRVFNKHTFELTYPFRYEGYIAECATYLRSHILNGVHNRAFDPFCWKEFIDTKKDFDIIGDYKAFDRRMLDSFHKDLYYTKYIAYNVWAYQKKGKWLRNKLKPNEFDFEVGDDIISKTNYYKNNMLLIQNGYQGIIKGKRLMRVGLIWINNGGDYQFYRIHNKKYSNEGSLKKYYAQLLNLYAEDIKVEELKYWSHDIDEQKFIPTLPYNPNQLDEILSKLKDRNSIHPQSDYDHNWEAYREIQDFFCDIQYAYALTSHTAQGSTYNNVFVSIRNIFAEEKTTDLEKLQSLYVAMTRASNSVLGLY